MQPRGRFTASKRNGASPSKRFESLQWGIARRPNMGVMTEPVKHQQNTAALILWVGLRSSTSRKVVYDLFSVVLRMTLKGHMGAMGMEVIGANRPCTCSLLPGFLFIQLTNVFDQSNQGRRLMFRIGHTGPPIVCLVWPRTLRRGSRTHLKLV